MIPAFVNLVAAGVIQPAVVGAKCATEPVFFGLVPWYHYLSVDPATCDIKDFNVLGGGVSSSLPFILMAVLDDVLRIAGMIAVGYVIYGGIQYVVSQGEPDKTAKAQSTILNAIIGLAVALIAVGAVSFVGGKLGTK